MPEKKFNSPEDMEHIEEHIALPHGLTEKAFFDANKLAVFPGTLLGTWVNVNPATRGMVKVIVELAGATLSVHPFGACVPTPCDWGRRNAIAYAANVSARPAIAFSVVFPQGFKNTIVVGHLEGSFLEVETFNDFVDGSGRSDYYSRELFRRG